MYRVLFTLLLFIPDIVLACRTLDWGLLTTKDALINNAHTIVLAKAKNYNLGVDDNYPVTKNHRIEFSFIVEESLKGKPIKEISLLGYDADHREAKPSDLNGHQKDAFWRRGSGGNLTIGGDCGAYGTFEIDQQYLLTLKEGFHINSFELVNSKDDLWYKYVKERIKTNKEGFTKLSTPSFDIASCDGSKFEFEQPDSLKLIVSKVPVKMSDDVEIGDVIAEGTIKVNSFGGVSSEDINVKRRRKLHRHFNKTLPLLISETLKKLSFSTSAQPNERCFKVALKYNPTS
ncbi:hypothetical protein KO495_10365 [Colwellia sp. D2M02]|uniref:hypothetical protein n=1 Tax=Colwellia sp. D2M02 TaxID=2841562 RepID=UPI001C08D900|nr:hypothetical protein [Colwellia sp. D2M02]MBU2893724.1 hypothetical protein [Colwellia sp. D2M02]